MGSPLEIPTDPQYLTDELALSSRPVAAGSSDPSTDAVLLQELYSAGALVDLLVTSELAQAGVSPSLFSFLGWIAVLQPVTPGALAAETGMPPTTIRDHVRRVVARGDVRKVPNPADGRSYHLVLSPQGRRLMERGWPAVVAAFGRLAPHLREEPATYVETVRELRAALRAALGGGRPARQS
jgi:DNA-binding MarR family transcriptional regulator